MRDVFDEMDEDGSGALDRQEVSEFCARIGSPCLRQCVHGVPIGGDDVRQAGGEPAGGGAAPRH
eukprot:COSAG01_NODE_23182_length_825_cov_1.162534_1_plen_63_part_01